MGSMLAVDIDSEKKENRITTEPQIVISNHCVLIMEPAPMNVLERAPIWRVSVEVSLRDPVLGNEDLRAMLPAVALGPIMHARQVVAVARYPSPVCQWSWFFESDAGRARAKIWLHPLQALGNECGIFVLPTLAARGVTI